MSQFSHALADAIDSLGWSQKHLSEKTGVPAHQMSRYVRGHLDIGIDNLEIICKALPADQRGRLIQAWLQDRIPPSGQSLVTILTSDRVQELPNMLPDNMDPDLREAILQLSKRAVSHRSVRDMLVSFAASLRAP